MDDDNSVPGPGHAPPGLCRGPGRYEIPRARAAPPQRSGMKIDVYFTPLGLTAGELTGRAAVVIDVLRATSTIVTALAAGAKAIVPAASSEEVVRLTANLEKNGIVLAGERRLVKIEGFNLGNSPREMTREAVGGKTVFLATTNGTPALLAARGASRCWSRRH